MGSTDEQLAADAQLESALSAAAGAYGLVDHDQVVTSWVVVGAAQGEDATRTTYFHLHPGGVQPNHVAVGLLRVAEKQLLDQDDE